MNLGLKRWPVYFEKTVTHICRILNNIGIAFLMMLMVVITLDVILRAVTRQGIIGTNELAEFMMVLVVFLAIAYTQLRKSNIKVELIFSRFPERAQAIINSVIYIIVLGVSILIVWQCIVYQENLQHTNRVSEVLHIPVAPFQFFLIIGFSLLCVVLFMDLVHSIREAAKS